MATFTTVEQRAYIKIEYYRGTKGVEILNTLQSVCGKDALPKTTVYRWIDQYKEGRNEVEIKHSPGRPVDATASENVEKVQELLNNGRRWTCEEVAREAGISRGSAHTILTTILRRRRIAARWVPNCLSDGNASCHKSERVTSLMASYEWEVLPHPAYISDMSPPDFDLLSRLKEPLRGIRFDDLKELKVEVANQVRYINSGCLATGVRDLPRRWESVIEKKGCYIEGM